MSNADTLAFYREALTYRKHDDTATDAVLRELHTTADEWTSNADLGESVAIHDIGSYPALVKRCHASWVVTETDGRNFLGWASYATEELARDAYDDRAAQIDPPEPDAYVCGQCLCVLINGDGSGHDDHETEEASAAWWETAERLGLAYVTTSADTEGEFRWDGCEICSAHHRRTLGDHVYGVLVIS